MVLHLQFGRENRYVYIILAITFLLERPCERRCMKYENNGVLLFSILEKVIVTT